MDLISSLLPVFILQIPVAILGGLVAKRLGKNVWLWVILLLIPVLGFIGVYAIFYKMFIAGMDRLDAILDKLNK